MAEQFSKNDLIAKARGFTKSIEKMDEKQKAATPSGDYGEDYNKLRRIVERLYPQLADLLPPLVRVNSSHGSGYRYTEQSYSEIDTFCEQIIQLLSGRND